MRDVTVEEIKDYLDYNNLNTPEILQVQLDTRSICKTEHNQWEQLPYFGAGKYVFCAYKCAVCGKVHYEFELNNYK